MSSVDWTGLNVISSLGGTYLRSSNGSGARPVSGGRHRTGDGPSRALGALALTVVVVFAVLAAGIGPAAGATGNTSTIVVDDDPSTGEYGSIDAAVANASAGDTIAVRNGTYEEQVTVDRSVTIVADGNATLAGSDTLDVGVAVTADDVTVRGLTVRNYSKWGVTVSGDAVHLRQLRITENHGGVKFADTANSSLRTATVTGYERYQASGIYAVNARNVTVRNATLSSDTHIITDDLTFDNVTGGTIAETNVTRNPIHAVVLRNGTTDVTVADNHLRSSKRDALFVNRSSGNVIDGNVIVGTGEPGDFYNDEDGIHIRAAPNNSVTNNRVTGSTGDGIAISSSTELAGNVLMHNAEAGLSVSGLDDAVISNVTVRDNGHGVRVANAENLTVADATLTGNHHGLTLVNTTNATVLGAQTRGHNTGYYIENTTGTLLADSRAVDGEQNNWRTPPGRGVQLVSTNGTDLRNVTLVENGNIGVLASGTANVTIADSRLVNNQYYGIRIRNGARNTTVTNTTVRGHYDVGIEVTADGTTIRDNHIVDNYDYGIEVTSGVAPSSVTVVDNVIEGSDGWAGLRNRNGSTTLDATHNWWGDGSGPGGAGGGVGTKVMGNVTFRPFYVDRALTTLSTDATRAELAGVRLANYTGESPSTVRPYDHTRTLNVSRVTFTGNDYYVALHNRTSDGSLSPAIGISTRLSPGVHDDVPVDVNATVSTRDDVDALTEEGTYVAVVHLADDDGPGTSLTSNGDPVADDGYVALRPIPNITFTNQSVVGGTQTVQIDRLNRTGGVRLEVLIYEDLTPNDDTRNLSEPLDRVTWYEDTNPKTDVEMEVADFGDEVTENTTYVVHLTKIFESGPLDTPVSHAESARLTVLPYQDDIVVDPEPGQGDTSTISGALANASENATIIVREGVYREQLTVEKDVTIRATNATLNGTTVESSSGPSTAIDLGSRAAPTIDGLDITGYDRAIDARGSGGSWNVTNAVVTDTDGTAINAYHSDRDWRLSNVVIRNASGAAVNATDTDGDWTVRDVRIEDVRNETETAVEPPETILRTEEEAPTARPGRGIDARRTHGDWTVESVAVLNATTAVRGSGTGAMRVTESRFETDIGVDGTVRTAGESTTAVDARHNWWGARSGPGGGVTGPAGVVADGEGATVDGAVRFAPFYTDRTRQTLALGDGADDLTSDGNASAATVPVDVVGNGPPVDQVSVRVAGDATGSVDVTVVDAASAPKDVATRPEVNETLSVVNISVPASARDTGGRVEMRIDRDGLDRVPSTLRIAHYDATAGEWEMLSTTVVATTDQSVTVAAETDEFSPFAVVTGPQRTTDDSGSEDETDADDGYVSAGGGGGGAAPSDAGEDTSDPSFTVRLANATDNLTAGEQAAITARVTNGDDDAATFDAVWYVDDRRISHTSRTVAANATRAFVLNRTFAETGPHTVSLSKRANLTVTVHEPASDDTATADTSTATATRTASPTDVGGDESSADGGEVKADRQSASPEPTSSSVPGFGVVVSLVALGVVALRAWRSG